MRGLNKVTGKGCKAGLCGIPFSVLVVVRDCMVGRKDTRKALAEAGMERSAGG